MIFKAQGFQLFGIFQNDLLVTAGCERLAQVRRTAAVSQLHIIEPEFIASTGKEAIIKVYANQNTGNLVQVCILECTKLFGHSLPVILSEIHTNTCILLNTIAIHIEQLDFHPLPSILCFYIHRNVLVGTDIHRRCKAHAHIGPTDLLICPNMDGVLATVGYFCCDLCTGTGCKAILGKDTGSKYIIGIQLGNIFLIGIMHQTINVHIIAGRNADQDTNDLAAVFFLITL